VKDYAISHVKHLSVDPVTVNAVNTYLLAKAHAEVWRERVEPIQRDMLKMVGAVYADKYEKHAGEPITNPKHSWRMSDEKHREWCEELDHEYRSRGWLSEADEFSVCPLLKAEELQRQAERAVLLGASAIIEHLEPDGLICSGLENYRKGLDLVVSLIVNAPTYRRPSMPVAV
jgi:hypothetical protein